VVIVVVVVVVIVIAVVGIVVVVVGIPGWVGVGVGGPATVSMDWILNATKKRYICAKWLCWRQEGS
jgi:uncharacterized protein (DUF983 family)